MSKQTKTVIKSEEKVTLNVTNYEKVFSIVENQGTYYICVGQNVISQQHFSSVEDAKAYIDDKPWELIINATCLIYDMSKKAK